jgi:sugar phosphate isomerase/epimerase
MMEWPVGLSTGCFYKTPILDALESIRGSGFTILELSSASSHLNCQDSTLLHKLRKELSLQSLEVYSLHAPWGEQIDISSPRASERKAAIEELTQATAAAAYLGARYFVLHAGPERHDLPEDEWPLRMRQTASALNELAELCERSGLELVLENKLGHLFAGSIADLLWLFGSIRVHHCGLCLDTGHAFLARDLQGITQKMSGHLRMVHASDNLGNRDDHLPPGKGAIHWRNLLSHLRACRFAGALILELGPEANLEEAAQARHQLRLLMRSPDPQ